MPAGVRRTAPLRESPLANVFEPSASVRQSAPNVKRTPEGVLFVCNADALWGNTFQREYINFALFPLNIRLYGRIRLFYKLHHPAIRIYFTPMNLKKVYSYTITARFSQCFILRRCQALVTFLPHPRV